MRLKFGASKPVVKEAAKPLKEQQAVAKPQAASLKRSNAAKKGVQEAFPSKAQVKKTLAAKSAPAKTPAKKTVAKKTPVKAAVKVAVKKVAARKTAARKA